jgi:hypothetical protein
MSSTSAKQRIRVAYVAVMRMSENTSRLSRYLGKVVGLTTGEAWTEQDEAK